MRAYRGRLAPTLVASTQTCGRSRRFCSPSHIEASQPLKTRPRTARVADCWIWQGCGHQGPLIARKVLSRFAKGAAGSRFGAEFTVGAPLCDIQVNFQNPPLRQNQVDPERQRKFQRLADVAAPLPKEQILCHLLSDG